MEFFKGANMDLVQHHYGLHCGLVWDGYSLPSLDPNGSLAGLDFQLTTFMTPGLNDYYDTGVPLAEVKDMLLSDDWRWQLGGQEVPDEKTFLLWCGEFYHFYRHISLYSGAKVSFVPFPNGLDAIMELTSKESVYTTIMEMFLAGYDLIPIVRIGSYVTNMDYGHVIMIKRYYRKEFLFLQSFTPGVWGVILLAILVLAVVMSLLSNRKYTWSETVTYSPKLLAIMLSECQDLHLKSKMLVSIGGLWFLTATILAGCMQGSMRELMRFATETVVANNWDELFHTPMLDDLMVVTINILPTWTHFSNAEGDLKDGVDIKQSRGLLKVIELDLMSMNLGDMFIDLGVLLVKGFQHFALVIFSIAFNMSIWMAAIYRGFAEEWLSEVLSDHSNDHQAGRKFYDDLFALMYSEIFISQPQGEEKFFMMRTSKGPDIFWDYLHTLVNKFRDFGFVYRMNIIGDMNIAERFFPHRLASFRSAEDVSESESSYEPISLKTDLLGLFILSGSCLLVTLIVLIAESIVIYTIKRQKNKLKKKNTKCRKRTRTNDSQMSSTFEKLFEIGLHPAYIVASQPIVTVRYHGNQAGHAKFN